MIEVVGIGASGWDSLSPAARALVGSADRVLGSRRQLDLLPNAVRAERVAWPTPLLPALPGLLSDHDHRPAVVLASGDPLLAGIGSTLVERFGPAAVRVHPNVSSVALARARMGWAAEDVSVVRLNFPGADELRRYLAPGQRLVVLSRDGDSPAEVAAVLREEGFGLSPLTVLTDLGTDQEARTDGPAQEWDPIPAAPLNIVGVICVSERLSPTWSSTPGLADEAYHHDGQLTKRDVRASALAHLMPVPGQLLWDVGAGAGSVGIEWLRAHPSCRAVAVERDPARAKRISSNATRLGVPGLRVLLGEAPAALSELPTPDAVFIGGGASAETIDQAWAALAPGGRLVVPAVTVETELLLHRSREQHGGGLTRITVEHLEPIGGFTGWKPARAVVQWSVQKPLRP